MELFRALGACIEPPGPPLAEVTDALGLAPLPHAADHTELFAIELPPYASIYLSADGGIGGEARDRVEGFWRALGYDPPAQSDHLSVMLSAYARLADLEAAAADTLPRERYRRAREAYLREHLLSWLPVYLLSVSRAGSTFYERWATLLTEALAYENARGSGDYPLPLHLRHAQGAVVPAAESLDSFITSLLVPVRSGWVLTRRVLAHAAGERGLSLRLAPRSVALKELLAQDSDGALTWLAQDARRWSLALEQMQAAFGSAAAWWSERASNTATVLEGMKEEAREQGNW